MSISKLTHHLSYKIRIETENFVKKFHISKQFFRIKISHRISALITSIARGLLSARFIHIGRPAVMPKKGLWKSLRPHNNKYPKRFEKIHDQPQSRPKESFPLNALSLLEKSPSLSSSVQQRAMVPPSPAPSTPSEATPISAIIPVSVVSSSRSNKDISSPAATSAPVAAAQDEDASEALQHLEEPVESIDSAANGEDALTSYKVAIPELDVSKTGRTAPKVSSQQIADAVHARNLRKIQVDQKNATQPIILEKLGTTQNPVAVIAPSFYIAKDSLKNLTKIPITRDRVSMVLNTYRMNLARQSGSLKDLLYIDGVINMLLDHFDLIMKGGDRRRPNPKGDPALAFTKMMKMLASEIFSFEEEGQNIAYLNHLKALSTALDELTQSLSLDNVPIYYRQSDIVNNIDHMEGDDQLELLNHLKTIPGEYTSKGSIKSIPDEYISKDRLEAAFVKYQHMLKSLTRNLPEFCNSQDIIIHNSQNPAALDIVKKSLKLMRPSMSQYVVKIGGENAREVLMGKLVKPLEIQDILVPKTDLNLPKAKISEYSDLKTIASVYIEDGSDFSDHDWHRYLRLRQELAVARYKKDPDASRIEEHLKDAEDLITSKRQANEYNRLKAELTALEEKGESTREIEVQLHTAERAHLRYGSSPSIWMQGFLDMLFCSYDSHIRQYKVQDGKLINFDFARFLAPGEVFTRSNETFAAFRSTFLDHPCAYQSVPEEIKVKLKTFDISKFKAHLATFAGTEKEFEQATDAIEQHNMDLFLLESQLSDRRLRELATTYGILDAANIDIESVLRALKDLNFDRLRKHFADLKNDPFNGDSAEDALQNLDRNRDLIGYQLTRNQLLALGSRYSQSISESSNRKAIKADLETKIKAGKAAIKEVCFSKVHPGAYKSITRRLDALTKVLETRELFTLAELFEAMYPQFQPFMKVLTRIEPNPSSAISVVSEGRGIALNSFEKIIAKAEKHQLASPEELDEMRSSLAILKQEAVGARTLATTMDIFG